MTTIQFAEVLFKSLWGLWLVGVLGVVLTIIDLIKKY